jgi:toxin ParE1/3/4
VRQADKYFNAFFDQFEIIAQRPYSFEAVDFIKPGYRQCVCGVDCIYFKVKGNQVLIIAVLGRQEFKAD